MVTALRTLVLIFAAVFSIALRAQNLPANVVDMLRKEQVPTDALGVYVQQIDASDAAPLINWRVDVPMQPASTMKMVTSYAALNLLGPAFTWKTNVYANGSLVGDVLNGDLIIQGGGDPHLVLENFWLLLRQIRARGIREIHGNLIIDSSWMEPQPFDAADFDADPTRPYNVGPSSLLVNFNVLELQLHQSAQGVQADTSMPLVLRSKIEAQIVNGTCSDWRSGLTPVFSLQNNEINLNLSGTYPASCGDKTWWLQPYPLSSNDFTGALFRELWKQTGGEFSGAVLSGQLPAGAGLLTTFQSAPLANVLRDMNKYSNNVMARLVMLTLDREASHAPANARRAAQLVQLWFAGLGIDAQGLQLENGSGLSRNERISAIQMGRMLAHAFNSPTMPELLSSMPLLGVDGTMQKRAAGLAVAGHAHLKTGGLEGVRNFAGYVTAASGKRYVAVCFVNHKNARQTEAAQDALLQWIYEHG